ncbi:MAG: helicase-exonuclease AddAB subunit AddA [Lachnospiraceae bacterium]|nr:helicase-exonuclease AddAB subunit AddA [Lachnospiraceae bacterium]
MGFTTEQKKAIDTRGATMLVSAAAGSGKTTVLVERIIRRILDDNDPVDIDRMLVMTFTKAAASQMKDKIFRAIEEKKAQDPLNRNLIRQSALVHNARISTIHGFCLNVIRDHFQEIGIDPDFRVADEAECRLLKQGVIESVIEKAYEEGSEGFINLTECLSPGRSDYALEGVLESLYDFSMSYPDPDEWLETCIRAYDGITEDNIDGQPWMKVINDNAILVIEDALRSAELAGRLSLAQDGPYMYAETIDNDIKKLEELHGHDGYDGLKSALSDISWDRIPRSPKDGQDIDPEIRELVKNIRNNYKFMVDKLKKEDFSVEKSEQVIRIKACAPVVRELVRLTREVRQGFDLIKREKKVVDFNDLEHYCISILAAADGNTAREYREFFEEIYVDEYQDSNLVQEELLKHIARPDNLFMVGDVKQSIYSFRLARPQLFVEKYEDPGILRIDLTHNFRSRTTVLDTVNELFSQIMSRKLGGIDYDEAARLNPGAHYPGSDNKGSELIIIGSEELTDDKDLEARVIAKRIHELMKEQTVSDPTEDDPDHVRPLRYSDIVILLRTAKGWDNRFGKVLTEEGIPVYVTSQMGYFSAYEVSILLDYLTVIDNPLQDIPMAAVLRSMLGCFDDEELALLKMKYPAKYLYHSVEMCEAAIQNGEKDEDRIRLAKKAVAFLERYRYFRDKVEYTPVYELLLEIIEGDYGTYISSLPSGKRKMANLNMLLKKAEDYGKVSFKGLFHFVRYIEMLKKYDVDYGEAGLLDENADAVAIMTIHKSKGLEFPVCFVAGMKKVYNFMDSRARILPDIDFGIGLPYSDPVRRVQKKTILKHALARKRDFEIRAEEERVLYVAMTRAKEKLIMTGVVNDTEKALGSYLSVNKCNSYLDLLIYGLNNKGLPSLEVTTVNAADLIDSGIREAVSAEESREELRKIFNAQHDEGKEDALTKLLRERFAFAYPYENEKNMFEKVSVTELKRRFMHENEDKELPDEGLFIEGSDMDEDLNKSGTVSRPDTVDEVYIPDFIREQEKEIPPTLYGTAVHRVFEIWDYNSDGSDEDIRGFMEQVKARGLMEKELADCVGINSISRFVNSPLAARMKKAFLEGRLYREQPFMFSYEGMLIQGIIDAYFIEDDRIVIVDYKTDRVGNMQELKDRYHVQLEYYGKALSALLSMPVGELIIYSVRLADTVIC